MKPKNRQEEIHWNHQIDFQKHITKPRYKSRNSPELKTRIQCRCCDVYIRWPSADEINHWNKHQMKFTNITLHDFIIDFERNGIKSPNWQPRDGQGVICIPLNATYQDRHKMKQYKCQWYPGNKQFNEKGYWYTFSYNDNLEYLLPWIEEPHLTKLHEYLSTLGNHNPYTDSFTNDESHNFGVFRLRQIFK